MFIQKSHVYVLQFWHIFGRFGQKICVMGTGSFNFCPNKQNTYASDKLNSQPRWHMKALPEVSFNVGTILEEIRHKGVVQHIHGFSE